MNREESLATMIGLQSTGLPEPQDVVQGAESSARSHTDILPSSPRWLTVRRFLRHRLAMCSIAFIGVLAVLAILAPIIAPHDPNSISTSAVRAAPSAEHLFGTDAVGRDVLSRLLFGARVSLTVGVAAAVSAAVIGTSFGLLAGLFGGWVDAVIMRLVDIVLSFPSLLVILLLVTILGPSIVTIIVVIALFEWPLSCRIVRQVSLSTKELDFVLAARAVGARQLGIMYRHMITSVLPPLTVTITLMCAAAILLEAALSFLGLGVRPPQATWGAMLQAAQSLTVLQQMPWLWIPPGLAIAGTVLAINFIGDGLRDAFDPRQRS
ncbi:ABC transporter permease [Phytoactinopolyspora endophytica]|uniref:ABC transporter permease n=1 Tax=Phytoactinopolyspora endophytica TaxID=1642495 RepID=UPI00197BBC32|nr:ABC transporter permease [Phytoactinopolyspora endophytica]